MSLVRVCFTYADRKHWWTNFLKPGFSHVYVLIPVKDGHILVSPNFGNIQVEYLLIGQKLSKNLRKPFISVNFCTDVNLKVSWFRPFSCVEVVKRILGIDQALIFTPYQLYRYVSWVHLQHQKQPLHKKRLK